MRNKQAEKDLADGRLLSLSSISLPDHSKRWKNAAKQLAFIFSFARSKPVMGSYLLDIFCQITTMLRKNGQTFIMWYNNKKFQFHHGVSFGAGWNSRPAVMKRLASQPASRIGTIRCDSGADSIVWMGEGSQRINDCPFVLLRHFLCVIPAFAARCRSFSNGSCLSGEVSLFAVSFFIFCG
jgi:hypothetical protein